MNTQDLISEIKNDRRSGASELTVSAVGCLLVFSEGVNTDDPKTYLEQIIDTGKQIVEAQPSMAPLFYSINGILLAVERKFEDKCSVAELKNIMRTTSREFIVTSKKAMTMIKEQIADLVENDTTILTHSYSSTVIESLSFVNTIRRNIMVIATESRPMFEGRNTAQILSSNGVKTLLIADMASFHFLDKVDLILTGSDCICESGIVNKIGTKGLAMAASQLNIPFFVVAEKNKFLPSKFKSAPVIEEKEPNEILENVGEIEVKNIYFDITPYKFINGIVTEEGIMDQNEVLDILRKLMVSTRFVDK